MNTIFWNIILVLCGIIVPIIGFGNEIAKIKKLKIFGRIWFKILLTFIALSIAGLATYKKEQISSEELKLRDSTNKKELEIRDSLNRIKLDSLQSKCNSILSSNEQLNFEIDYLKNSTKEGFNQNQKSIKNITQVAGRRVISPDTRRDIIKILSKIKGKICIDLYAQDVETTNFAEALKTLFRESGWQTNNSMGISFPTEPFYGIEILYKKYEERPTGYYQIIEAFEKARIKCIEHF